MTVLGTCYYPEHWPEDIWAEDARRMVDLGLTWVRIGEFAWSRIEPEPDHYDWAWLDRAVDTLAAAGLKIVMGTPTATPPRWMLDRHPDMLAVDADGHPRRFGSRRHYCFSHLGYRAEAAKIAGLMAQRYGAHPAIGAWQTDNEYGCHDTTISYSDAARTGFRDWLAQKYQSSEALNQAWGNVFWSMEYHSFDEIDLPNLTVTEPNPSHLIDFRRFTSDQVVAFNAAQVAAIRAQSKADILHNYMGQVTKFDHFDVGADLDIATWDSYPLGFLEDRIRADDAFKTRFANQGHPDFQAFHHDLYRAVGKSRWWIMEQQPGPVNWAPYNPAPAPGMIALWAIEAAAHGAEAVCYFRWRQAPFAQEQMHAGLLRPDNTEAEGFHEAAQALDVLAPLGDIAQDRARVALVFDYPSQWAWEIQPQSKDFDYFQLVFETYSALRARGLSVDFIGQDPDALADRDLVLVPAVFTLAPAFKTALSQSRAHVLYGPRCNSKTPGFQIPASLPPDLDMDVTVTRVETLRPGAGAALAAGTGQVTKWMEHVSTDLGARLSTEDGVPVLISEGTQHYLTAWLDAAGLTRTLDLMCQDAGLETQVLPEGLRIRETARYRFWINYQREEIEYAGRTIAACAALIEER